MRFRQTQKPPVVPVAFAQVSKLWWLGPNWFCKESNRVSRRFSRCLDTVAWSSSGGGIHRGGRESWPKADLCFQTFIFGTKRAVKFRTTRTSFWRFDCELVGYRIPLHFDRLCGVFFCDVSGDFVRLTEVFSADIAQGPFHEKPWQDKPMNFQFAFLKHLICWI